jgi:hypothetical protein
MLPGECEWKQGESAVANSGKSQGNLAPPAGRRSPVSVHPKHISERRVFEGVLRLPLVGDRPHL